MGILAQRLAGAFETRNDEGWLTRDDGEDPHGSITPSGVRVNARAALSLTTIWRCIDLLASAVSGAPKDITLKVAGKSFEQYTKPTWLSAPNPTDETFTSSDHFMQVALSLLLDGNFFVAALPYVLDPQALIVLNPGQVDVKPGPVYDIKDANGKVITTLRPRQMLHGRWLPMPGSLRAISPLEALRRGIGSAIAAEEYASRYFGQGSSLSFGVEVPTGMDKEKKARFREQLRDEMAGRKNQHLVGVLTDGAKFVGGLAPTAEQAQMLDTRKFSVEDLCRPYGVPPAMAGSTEPGAASFASTDTYDRWFKERAVLPVANRIESQYDRLLMVPPSVGDQGASMQFRFNLDAIARVSLLTRYQAYGEGVTKGVLTPNEARGYEDQPPLPGGDRLYVQQQMVPLESAGVQPETGVAA